MVSPWKYALRPLIAGSKTSLATHSCMTDVYVDATRSFSGHFLLAALPRSFPCLHKQFAYFHLRFFSFPFMCLSHAGMSHSTCPSFSPFSLSFCLCWCNYKFVIFLGVCQSIGAHQGGKNVVWSVGCIVNRFFYLNSAEKMKRLSIIKPLKAPIN